MPVISDHEDEAIGAEAVGTTSPGGSKTAAAVDCAPVDRHAFGACDVVREAWLDLQLPSHALAGLDLPERNDPALPSSYKIGILAQSCIALSALAAALVHAARNHSSAVPGVRVFVEGAVVEFKSERLYAIDGRPAQVEWGAIGGLYKTLDGHVRVHGSFPNHANGTLELLGLPLSATRDEVSERVAEWTSVDLETAGTANGKVAIYALRSYQQWDALQQSLALGDMPILLQQLAPGNPKTLPSTDSKKCLRGLRVLEMSRVIAAPVAGRTLAAQGADVLWVTSPNLPDLPGIDRDFGRGKRTVQLDIHAPADKERLIDLIRTCDVFIQSFRPGSLASYGFSPQELVELNPDIICANMSAFGPSGPWARRRGFDSLVQTCSGMNVSEAEHAGDGEAARAMPCQALDHAGGYLLATGVLAAVYHRGTRGGAWRVDVSLAGVMKHLRSLGQYPGSTGFDCEDYTKLEDVPVDFLEVRETGFGQMRAVKHCAAVDGCEVGWEVMPKPLGSDRAEWMSAA